ncbi:MAG: ribonuclease P protein component [Bacteroidia bacterium]|nr:ribonuclease P protein component [Bacteroidia bacterium]
MNSPHSLSKAERLRGKKCFSLIRRFSRSLVEGELRLYAVYFALSLDSIPLKAAFSVPKKSMRKATRRNRMKRLMREAFRLEKPSLRALLPAGEAWLVWQWNSPELPTLHTLRPRMVRLFERFSRECVGS